LDASYNYGVQVDIVVNKNRAVLASSKIEPVYKVVTVETSKPGISAKKVFEPFVSAGFSTLGIVSAGGGAFYHSLGLEYQYQRQYATGMSGHSFGVKWKF
jgi:hypothetical protein